MLTQQTLEKLYDMKLTAMADAFTQQMGQPDLGELSFEHIFLTLKSSFSNNFYHVFSYGTVNTSSLTPMACKYSH